MVSTVSTTFMEVTLRIWLVIKVLAVHGINLIRLDKTCKRWKINISFILIFFKTIFEGIATGISKFYSQYFYYLNYFRILYRPREIR